MPVRNLRNASRMILFMRREFPKRNIVSLQASSERMKWVFDYQALTLNKRLREEVGAETSKTNDRQAEDKREWEQLQLGLIRKGVSRISLFLFAAEADCREALVN
ncbi:hypothetical protein TWF481_001242 [Arthrobotrys musiformis]|uniref:Uncharacterized protein n=1 Tax=Arthrobotrys musiformis TaxID=47236 RepID=A0AAV9WPZ3_9PEZI